MEMKRYHIKDPGGFPEGLELQEGFYRLKYTNHAMERFIERAGNDPVYPKVVNVDKSRNVLEIYSEDGKMVHQILVRIQYKHNVRMFLVLVPFSDHALVKTIWFTEKGKINEKNSGRVASLAISNVA